MDVRLGFKSSAQAGVASWRESVKDGSSTKNVICWVGSHPLTWTCPDTVLHSCCNCTVTNHSCFVLSSSCLSVLVCIFHQLAYMY